MAHLCSPWICRNKNILTKETSGLMCLLHWHRWIRSYLYLCRNEHERQHSKGCQQPCSSLCSSPWERRLTLIFWMNKWMKESVNVEEAFRKMWHLRKQFGYQLLQGIKTDILGSVFTKVFLRHMHKSSVIKPGREYAIDLKIM